MEIVLEWIVTYWEICTGALAIIFSWNKDKIINKLSVKQKEADVSRAERSIDSIYIANSEKLVELYSRSMDELTTKHRAEIADIRQEHALNIKEFKEEAREMGKVNEDSRVENKLLHETVQKLERQVNKLERFIGKLGKKVRFYEENSDVVLPSDLRD